MVGIITDGMRWPGEMFLGRCNEIHTAIHLDPSVGGREVGVPKSVSPKARAVDDRGDNAPPPPSP